MNIFKHLLGLANKISGGVFFKKYAPKPAAFHPETDSHTWKVDWINEQGKKGTFDTKLTDQQEAEWKFNYMFDDTSKIIRMYKGPALDKET